VGVNKYTNTQLSDEQVVALQAMSTQQVSGLKLLPQYTFYDLSVEA